MTASTMRSVATPIVTPASESGGDEREEGTPRASAGSAVPTSSSQFTREVSGRRCGKRSTSRMADTPVSSITRRSMPMPSPAVGGSPYSSART